MRDAERGVVSIREDRKRQVNLCNEGLGAVLPEFREELLRAMRSEEAVLSERVGQVETGCGSLKESIRG